MQWWKISIFFDWLFPCIHLFSLLECCHLEQALSQMLNLKGFISSWTKEICSLKSIEIIKIQKQIQNVLFLGKVPFSTLPPKLKGLNLISNQERLSCNHFFVFYNFSIPRNFLLIIYHWYCKPDMVNWLQMNFDFRPDRCQCWQKGPKISPLKTLLLLNS